MNFVMSARHDRQKVLRYRLFFEEKVINLVETTKTIINLFLGKMTLIKYNAISCDACRVFFRRVVIDSDSDVEQGL